MQIDNPPKKYLEHADKIESWLKYQSYVPYFLMALALPFAIVTTAFNPLAQNQISKIFLAILTSVIAIALLAFSATSPLWFPHKIKTAAELWRKPLSLITIPQHCNIILPNGKSALVTIDFDVIPNSTEAVSATDTIIQSALNRYFEITPNPPMNLYETLEKYLDSFIAQVFIRYELPVWSFRIVSINPPIPALLNFSGIPIGEEI